MSTMSPRLDYLFYDHLKKLELDQLASFASLHALRGYHGYQFFDHDLLLRVTRALNKSTRIHKLAWLLHGADDPAVPFLTESASLRDLTLVYQNEVNHPIMASCLLSLQENPNSRIQRLELHTDFLPWREIAQCLIHSETLLVLDLKGKGYMDSPTQRVMSTLVELEQFSHALIENHSLKELHLQWVGFGSAIQTSNMKPLPLSIRQKKQMQSRNSSIHTLALQQCKFDSSLSAQILLQVMGGVRVMYITDTEGLESYLYKMHQGPNLHSLKVKTGIFPKGPWLCKLVKNHKDTLQSLSIESTMYGSREQSDTAIWHLLRGASSSALTSLDLKPNSFQEPEQNLISTVSHKMTSLTLHFPSHVEAFSPCLLGYLSSPQCSLKKVSLCISQNDMPSISRLCASLGTNKSLVDVEIDVKYRNYHPLAMIVFNWEEHLPRFTMKRFALTRSDTPSGFYEGFFGALPQCSTLTELDIGWISSFTDTTVDLLCSYLRQSSCILASLWLRGQTSTSANFYLVTKMFPALTENHSLRALSLACTRSDLNASVSRHLPDIEGLQHLELCIIGSADRSIRNTQVDFLQALRQNSSLVLVNVLNLADPNEYWFPSQLRFYQARNRVLQMVASATRSNQDIPPGLWPRLLARVQRNEWDPSIIFQILTTHMILHLATNRLDNPEDRTALENDPRTEGRESRARLRSCIGLIFTLTRGRLPKAATLAPRS
jgi:hypothetical protein